MPEQSLAVGTLWRWAQSITQGATAYAPASCQTTTASPLAIGLDYWINMGTGSFVDVTCGVQQELFTLPTHVSRLRELNEQRQRATLRAEQLFVSLLSEANRERFETNNEIVVTGSNGKLYRIECEDYIGNIVEVDTGNRYCAHPNMYVGTCARLPVPDAHITQMLALETDAEGFLAVANPYID